MTFSVGVLYSSQTLLAIVESGGLDVGNFGASFSKIEVADASVVLATAQKCRWLRIESDGSIQLTERGHQIRGLSTGKECLREQLFDLLIAAPPPWARRMIQGRFEALQAMPDEAQQCFKDCELTEGTDDDVVGWWDRASGSVRSERTKLNHDVGRAAEKLSLVFEKRRTGREPIWQAVETSVSGFDVLSVVDTASEVKLKIEVKGSRMPKNQASFFVTRNEWNTATKSNAFHFHLWLVRDLPKLFVVPAKDVEPHIPNDQGSGRWENAQLLFKDFGKYEEAVYTV
jgi:hypothetical protein